MSEVIEVPIAFRNIFLLLNFGVLLFGEERPAWVMATGDERDEHKR